MTVSSYELIDDIGVITLNNPPVNALSQPLREGLLQALQTARSDASRVVVLLCAGSTFIAGADIAEFGQPPRQPGLLQVLDCIENFPKPVIAAIHGTALGGGLEVALVCHYRCALASARVGLPEVKLGLLPGAGGTQRVTRLMGVEAAVDFITSGSLLPAGSALSCGLLDKVFDGGDLREQALAYAAELGASKAPLKKIRDLGVDPASVPDGFFESARKQVAKRARGQIAPERIVSLIEAAVALPFVEGLKRERELFLECLNSPQSAAMRHAFFAEREAAKVKDLPAGTTPRAIGKVAVIGAGTMGGGITMNFISAGIPVTLLELNEEALRRGMGIIEKNYRISASKGKVTQEQIAAWMALITATTRYEDLGDADLVIEAVFENLALKQEVFARLDEVCKPGCILASNTSYQNIDAIAASTRRPQDVCGMHFFSPANVMKLLENVRGAQSAPDVIATIMKLGRTIGKVPVLARVCYGFIGNRMLKGYGREAALCLIEGATPKQVDDALENFGMAMGPIAMGDLAGLDIGYKAREGLTEAQKGSPKVYKVADTLVEAGRLGQKTGKGYYLYDAQSRARIEDPEVLAIIAAVAAQLGVKRREISAQEIVERCLYGLINEGARILEEGIAQRPGDIDIVYLHGYGFPVAKGGPMYFADQVGLDKIHQRILEFREQLEPGNWEPAPLLQELAKTGKTFSAWATARQ
jgi:3-hydroxyacyl-CoA dehydrogenase